VARTLDPVLKDLRETLLLMGSRAEEILDKAMRSISERSTALAAEIPADDLEIDRLDVRIDDAVLRALALQAPVASDLREVLAIKMIATDLERVGDIARNIAKSAKRLAGPAEGPVPRSLIGLGESACRMLREALDAFSDVDPDRARRVMSKDDEIDEIQDEIVRHALEEIARDAERVSVSVDVIMVAKNLERVGDHATNIAEDVILVAEARNVKHAAKLGR